mmetsp:Transcript_20884/g.30055  ORF Transcript_20884/g.30055 Transcript_20884/m.30055 type:complete len:226 (+) Transcript_20884:618-1295(+)
MLRSFISHDIIMWNEVMAELKRTAANCASERPSRYPRAFSASCSALNSGFCSFAHVATHPSHNSCIDIESICSSTPPYHSKKSRKLESGLWDLNDRISESNAGILICQRNNGLSLIDRLWPSLIFLDRRSCCATASVVIGRRRCRLGGCIQDKLLSTSAFKYSDSISWRRSRPLSSLPATDSVLWRFTEVSFAARTLETTLSTVSGPTTADSSEHIMHIFIICNF